MITAVEQGQAGPTKSKASCGMPCGTSCSGRQPLIRETNRSFRTISYGIIIYRLACCGIEHRDVPGASGEKLHFDLTSECIPVISNRIVSFSFTMDHHQCASCWLQENRRHSIHLKIFVMDEDKSTDTFVARRGVAVGFLSLLSLLPPLFPLCSREWGRVHIRARLIQGPLVYISNIHCALSWWKCAP